MTHELLFKCPLCDAVIVPKWVDTAGAHYRCPCGFNSDSYTKVYYSNSTQMLCTTSPSDKTDYEGKEE